MRRAVERAITLAIDRGADIQWVEGYADPKMDSPAGGIFVANWNPRGSDPEIPTLESRVGKVLEHYCRDTVELEWSDTSAICDDCNKLIITAPQHMWDHTHYYVVDGDIVCESCANRDPEPYIEALLDPYRYPDSAPFDIDWESSGFHLCRSRYADSNVMSGERLSESKRRRERLKSNYQGVIDSDGCLWVRRFGWED